MKLVYAVDKISYNDNRHDGVVKKVEAQIAQFQRNGIETVLCQYIWKNGRPGIEIDADTDILYFRRIEPSVKLILKLRQLKRISPKLRVIMEIPTYPFVLKKEDYTIKKTLNRWIGLALLRYYVDRVIIIGKPVEKLYHIPTFCICNGIDYETIRLKDADKKQDGEEGIHLICVSSCARSHGYERVIEGLHRYYAQRNDRDKVYLHIVGEGRCLPEYKRMADKYKLTDFAVYFYGRKIGEELDSVYSKCQVGLVAFRSYITRVVCSSSLKAREYVAKGLPIVTDIKLDIDNKETNQYILSVPSDETPIDIQRIVEFYHSIYNNKNEQEVAARIRETFYPYCDWKFVFQDVIAYIKRGET